MTTESIKQHIRLTEEQLEWIERNLWQGPHYLLPLTIKEVMERLRRRRMSQNPGIICPYCQGVFYNMDLYKEHIEMEQDDTNDDRWNEEES